MNSEKKFKTENIQITELLLEVLEDFVAIYLKNIASLHIKSQFIYVSIIKIIQNMYMRISHDSDYFNTSRERIVTCLISIIKFKFDNISVVVPTQIILSCCRLLRKLLIDIPPSSAISLKNNSIADFCNATLLPLLGMVIILIFKLINLILGKLLYSNSSLDENSTFANLLSAVKKDDADSSSKNLENDCSHLVNNAEVKPPSVLKPFSSMLQMSNSFGNVLQQLLPSEIYPREIVEILSGDDAGRLPFLFQNDFGLFEKFERSKKRDHKIGDLKGLFALMLHSTSIKDLKKWTDVILELKKQDFNFDKKLSDIPVIPSIKEEESDDIKSKRLALYLERKDCRFGDDVVKMRVFHIYYFYFSFSLLSQIQMKLILVYLD